MNAKSDVNARIQLLSGAKKAYDKTIIELFEEAVNVHAQRIAVIDGENRYTYEQLNRRANQLAHRLREFLVGPDTIVAIMAERSFEMIAGVFGILKAGGAYLPIDVNYPDNRKKQMLLDSAVTIILVGNHCEVDCPNVLALNDEANYSENTENPQWRCEPHDLAYVMYTSGSTGTPKGVMIEHRSLANRIGWMQDAYPIDTADVIMQKTIYTFDVSVWEILWWSIQGAAVCMLPPRKEANVRTLVKTIEKTRVSVIHFVPSVLRIFLDYIETDFDIRRLQSLRYVFSSGEALHPDLVNRFNRLYPNEDSAILVNLYGPTEATVDVTHFPCEKNSEYTEIPIGKAIHNTYFLVLDDRLNMVEPEQIGDLYVGGINLARGYLHRPELTKQVFIRNPYDSEEIIYKTGDDAFYRENGLIFYQGRSDEQIKLRGIRIEIKEIEYHLLRCNGVKNALVMVKTDDIGNQFLYAYLIAADQSDRMITRVKAHLSENLPAYMIPSKIIFAPVFPLKPNGKVDRILLDQMCSGK